MDEIEGLVSRKEISFEEAETYFGGKVPVTASVFYTLAEAYKTLAFTVSGYTKAQVLSKFHGEVLAAITNGTTMETFRQNMNGFLETQGYDGLTPFQADNIFRTNVQTAYSVGRYEQMTDPAVLKLRPYWQYDAVEDKRTRPSHLAMDGKVFPADSPVWDTWYPPNGFRCRCTVRSLSERQVKDRELKVETAAPKAALLPDGRYTNVLPDPKFSTNPAKVPFTPDLSDMPGSIAKAYQNRQKGNTGTQPP